MSVRETQPGSRRFDPLSTVNRYLIALGVAMAVACGDVFYETFSAVASGRTMPGDNPVFDEAASNVDFVLYLALTFVYFRRETPDRIRARVAARDARPRTVWRRVAGFVWIGLWVATAAGAVWVAAFRLPHAHTLAPRAPGLMTGLAATDVILTWFALHTVYAEHYATLYYREGGGLAFPGEEAPDYLDFAYFSFAIGMTFGTTDVAVTSRTFRRTMLAHKLFSFGFNTAILALVFTILFQ